VTLQVTFTSLNQSKTDMPKVYPLLPMVMCLAACASNPKPAGFERAGAPGGVDARTAVHVLNRLAFGPRPGDVERIQALGLKSYLDAQLHPEGTADDAVEQRLATFKALRMSARTFATDYYQPMTTARQEFSDTQKLAPGRRLPHLGWHLLSIAAVSLPGGDKPISVLQQATVTPAELRFQRENQQIFDDLQAQKLVRAVYGERQLEEVLTGFWFNHFNVDARKIEDRPVVVEYERDVIRPHVLGRFRDLLGATAKSPAMLFYLDNWLSAAPPAPPASRPGLPPPARPIAAGRGLNENYGRELLELHTLGVDGGYTQKDVVEVARCFTGWTMRNPHDGTGFVFNDKMHDHGEKHVLGHTIKAGGGIEDGERVLDILARHPSTARFIATKLARHFVADTPPVRLVDRAAKTFRRTEGDLREVMRTIVTSPEFYAAPAYRAKVKTPFEYVASALRAAGASITKAGSFVGTISAIGEPLYQCQPPTGYGDRAETWINTGTLMARLNFAQSLAANGLNAATLQLPRTDVDLDRLVASVLSDDVSPQTRQAIHLSRAPINARAGLLLGSPEFQRR
jgi:uncharacterized protein (DUF1800 family)